MTSGCNAEVEELPRHKRTTQLDVHRHLQTLFHHYQQGTPLSANNKIEMMKQNNEG